MIDLWQKKTVYTRYLRVVRRAHVYVYTCIRTRVSRVFIGKTVLNDNVLSGEMFRLSNNITLCSVRPPPSLVLLSQPLNNTTRHCGLYILACMFPRTRTQRSTKSVHYAQSTLGNSNLDNSKLSKSRTNQIPLQITITFNISWYLNIFSKSNFLLPPWTSSYRQSTVYIYIYKSLVVRIETF